MLHFPTFQATCLAGIVLIFAWCLGELIYNLLLHPLRRFPGPVLCRMSPLVSAFRCVRGDGVNWVVGVHDQYGDCVRVGPNELSFRSIRAFKDIYGSSPGRPEALCKDPDFYASGPDRQHIGNSDAIEHARLRRIFTPAFTTRALQSQEPLLLAHADHLVARTRQCLLQEQKVHNVVALYTCVVADVISDMVLGDSIRTLDRLAFTPWLKTLLAITQTGVYLRLIRSSKLLALIISLYMRSGLARRQISDFKGFVEKHIDARLEADASRPDLWGLAATHLKDSKSLSREEMCNNALVFMLGGTETTASLLAGLTYLLLTHPEKMTRLTKEIRESFVDDADIILDNLRGLPYLNACIEEGLRLFPPTAIGLPRITPAGQVTIIDGHAVPGNTRVSVPLMALSHNPMYWTHPADFIPERWLDTAAQDPSPYAQDVREASQPFSMGRRACIGKSFAYHNIRLILSKLLWHFDLGLSRESEHWLPQKNYIVWERPPLNCSVALRSENSQATDGTE